MSLRAIPDTDPAPPPKQGNGHDDGRPCAFHAAELVETRRALAEVRDTLDHHTLVLEEIRDAIRAVSGRLDDEVEQRERWEEDAGFGLVEVGQKVDALIATIGEPPDPTTGKPGTGMRGQWVAALNAAIKGHARETTPSLLDEESEVTGVMDRETLVIAKRKAERDRTWLWRALIGLAITVVTTAGTVAIAWLTQGH